MIDERRVRQYVRTAENILGLYSGAEPLSRFLADYYKNYRQMGSRDRRMASRLIYQYFRLGKAISNSPIEARLTIADYLCNVDSLLVNVYLPDLQDTVASDLETKIEVIAGKFGLAVSDLFPFSEALSQGIDAVAFQKSVLRQPRLYIRIREGYSNRILSAIRRNDVAFELMDEFTVAFKNQTSLDFLKPHLGEFEVQDYTSQQTLNHISPKAGDSWWDACAGSGGKSLLLKAKYPEVNLMVSDQRGSILRNLDGRFENAGIRDYRRKIIDLTKEAALLDDRFDGIILDAPCSGSGTWGRTPEMITYFDPSVIARFELLQRQLADAVLRNLKSGKPLVYITCSAFARENEEVISYLLAKHDLTLKVMETIRGYECLADTMFVAVLNKN